MRTGTIHRATAETSIDVALDLDGTGRYAISTGIGFLDHMLEQLARHALIDLSVKTVGDLHVDQHHSVEDTALAIGQCLTQALGEKRGIVRYGEAHSPMDETLTRVALDISGRPFLVWHVAFTSAKARRHGHRDVRTLVPVVRAGGRDHTLHVECLYGSNNHHIAESAFKGLARALRQAVALDPRKAGTIPSTKGVL